MVKCLRKCKHTHTLLNPVFTCRILPGSPVLCCLCLVTQWSLTRWPRGLLPARPLCPRNSPGKNTGVDIHALLQGIFPTQGSNPGLPHCRQILSHQGSPLILEWVAHPFSRGSCWSRNPTGVSCIATSLYQLSFQGAHRHQSAHQAPPSMGFCRQEYWSGVPFPSPMHESEKWKWSRSVVSDS